jgi:hypothetical protein
VHVCISVAGANRGDNFGELLGADLLANIITTYGHNTRGGNRSRESARTIGTEWSSDWTGVRRGLTKPDHNAAVHTRLCHVDMGLRRHRSLQPTVAQLIIDGLIVAVDKSAKFSCGACRNDRDLLITDQSGSDIFRLGSAGCNQEAT